MSEIVVCANKLFNFAYKSYFYLTVLSLHDSTHYESHI